MHDKLIQHFQEQVEASGPFGSPFMAALLQEALADLREGGPVFELVGDWPGSPRADALALRLAGALHFAALSGRDAALAEAYPPRPWSMAQVWPLARDFLTREREWVRSFMTHPPQTNEPRRAIVLLSGFLHLAERFGLPMDLYEIGASAGLNQFWDRFAYEAVGWNWGDGALRLTTDWRGPAPPVGAPVQVSRRQACDLHPLDLTNEEQRLRLRAYIWPDQPERLARFDEAAALAVAQGNVVEAADAAEWLGRRLPERRAGALAIVYHSIFLQYPPPQVRAQIAETIAAAGAEATPENPLAWLRFEPESVLGGDREARGYLLDVTVWPGAERRVLAAADPHARWVEACA